MWASLRDTVVRVFPDPPGKPRNAEEFFAQVDEQYVQDAYHSLSIEGYRVTPELIEKVRRGNWNPDMSADDQEVSNTLAARGYHKAFTAVKESLHRILEGQAAAPTLRGDHPDLMNAFLTSGGFPWTLIHLDNRARYMAALEEASVNGNIEPFALCVRDEIARRS